MNFAIKQEEVEVEECEIPAKAKTKCSSAKKRVVKRKRKQKKIKPTETAEEKSAKLRENLKRQVEMLRAKKKPNFKSFCLTPKVEAPSYFENPVKEENESAVDDEVFETGCENVLEHGDSGLRIVSVVGNYESSGDESNDQSALVSNENRLISNPQETSSKLRICNKILQSIEDESNSNCSEVLENTSIPSTSSPSVGCLKPFDHETLEKKQELLEASRLPLMYFIHKKQVQENEEIILNFRKKLKSKVPLGPGAFDIYSDLTDMYNYIKQSDKRLSAISGRTGEVLPKIENRETKVPFKIESDDEIQQKVKSVMDKLLNYVDVLDETKYLHLNYEYDKNTTEEPILTESKVGRPIKRRFGPKSKKNKIPWELKRLNCQIVTIVNDENDSDHEKCTKDVCKLGCICRTLRCDSKKLLPTHCGSWKCIFNCSCTTNSGMGDTSLRVGNNLLNTGIINRLQDEAKKNLSKVEKEYLQTIIKTSDELIIVDDFKLRPRRVTLTEKNYCDDYYLED